MKALATSMRICLAQIAIFSIACLFLWSVSRFIYISFLYHERILSMSMDSFILLQGIRFDIVTIGYIIAIPMLLALMLSPFKKPWHYFQRLLTWYFCSVFAVVVFLELSTPSFIDQFDIRPNILFVEYLKYPKEVISTLLGAYSVDLMAACMIVPSATLGVWAVLRRSRSTNASSIKGNLILAPICIVVTFIGIRSTFDHRPVNPSVVAATPDLMVNSLALNSTYSVLYAVYAGVEDEKGRVKYGKMAADEAVSIVKNHINVPSDQFVSEAYPTLHIQKPLRNTKRPPNLVILLEESLGAEFVGSLGGLPLTPNLDNLKSEGLWFENMYATGTRSVRGIEAVVTGFPPTPARSVVKLQKSQKSFFTIAQLLGNLGYDTSFIYGGAAHFDNMRSFFVGNGFNTIIEEKDYVNPSFRGSWGVSDEDLFERAHATFDSYNGTPFFSLVFSSSNHSPFEYPEGKIDRYDNDVHTVNNAVKYADYALGHFFKLAKQSKYWDNTIFVVVADHNSRVYGDDLVPIERFHIPCLIIGAGVEPQQYARIASQIDLVPTLLSLMGISSVHPTVGVDLLDPKLANSPGRAIMQFHQTQAYRLGDEVVVLQPHQSPQSFYYKDRSLVPAEVLNTKLVATALAYSTFGSYAYNHQLYQLPPQFMTGSMPK